ncbi:unnamed protein product [Parnassius apollo]|uniref:(apollo) hypothetical protein n=1 Tax=Parnassius apollo TaxID=110799 RepID=A0A8S3WDQ5_PARAO|nr:unnamed protein product [Parnassius apollo]
MGLLIGLLKRIFKLLLYFALFIVVILVIPNLPPYTKFTNIELEPTQPRVGVLSPNEALNNAQQLFKDKLKGPEAFRIFDGELYTGLMTGEVVKISPGGHITFVTKIGQPCTGLSQEHICGRPLGFEIDEKNKLMYVADAYYGIWKVDLKTDKKQLLVPPNVEIDGKQAKIFNSIALDNNRDLYWTHSSSDYDLKDGAMAVLSDPSGRLLHYDSTKNISKVLLDNLWFANGVVISPDNQFVLVAETNSYRVMKYYINGPKKGTSEVFITGLPGAPDNLRVLPDGSGVLISLFVVFDNENPLISQSLANTPLARKFLARLSRLIEIPFEYLHEQYPHVVLEDIIYKIGHFSSISSMLPNISGLLQVDWNGNIVASYFNTDNSVDHISDSIVYNDKLYMGGPHLPYIASVPAPPLLKKAFTENKPSGASAMKSEESKKTSQPKVQSAPTAKVVKGTEKDKVKVVDMKDNKPLVQKSSEPSSPEKKAKVDSAQINKGNQQQKEKIVTKPTKIESETKPKSNEPKVTGAKPNTDPKKPMTNQNNNLKQPEEKPKVISKQLDEKQNKQEKIVKDSINKSDKPKVVTPEKVPHAKSTESKDEALKTTNEKPKVQKNKDTVKMKTSHTKQTPQNPVRDQIPVKEDIPSDRIKPNEETLKVIKKSGPIEIPNPN